MKTPHIAAAICAAICISSAGSGQPVARTMNVEELSRLAADFQVRFTRERLRATQWAAEHGRPLRVEHSDGQIVELLFFQQGRPVYFTTTNRDAADTVSTDEILPGGLTGLDLDALAVTLHQWDGGEVRITHQEFGARVIWADDTAPGLGDHSTHVAGTIASAGIDAAARGMAPAVTLECFDWENDNAEMATASASGAVVSNHSYGVMCGWGFDPFGDGEWYWFGDPAIDPMEDAAFGFYNAQAQDWDTIAFNGPFLLVCKSAGNDRGETHDGGHFVFEGDAWVWSTDPRDPDGGADGYDCIQPRGCAKNILTIGAVDDVFDGYTGPADVQMSSFSGWGPTDDGRVKPDIVANGVGVYSCGSAHDADYESMVGTSMASPSVAGTLGLLVQHYRATHADDDMRSATLKALVIHTADECGANPGPDYAFGWGLLNAPKAADRISADAEDPLTIQELTLADGEMIEQAYSYAAGQSIRATLCWTDPPGTPPAMSLDPTDPMLVNDLDLRIIGPGSIEYRPWILDPANPASPADYGDNDRDNVEHIAFVAPQSGEYVVRITHKGILGGLTQGVSLVLESQTMWEDEAKLLASDGAAHDWFGWSVALDVDTAVIGAFYDDDNGSLSGSAYVFVREGDVWTQQDKLLASDGAADDYFGVSVAVDGDTAIVGARSDDDHGSASGSAYVYVRTDGVWSQQVKITPDDGAAGDWFGYTVSLDGDTAVIGACYDDDLGVNSGSAYVYVRDGETWVQQARLKASDPSASALFGHNVSIDGDTVLIGAYRDNDNGVDSGSAYVFVRQGQSWVEQAKILPSDGAEGDFFARAVAISGDTAVMGTYLDDDGGTDSGSTYVFVRQGVIWVQQAKLTASDATADDFFGRSVSLAGDTAVIGAYGDDDNGSESGSAYVFVRQGVSWVQQAKLTAFDGAAIDNFGRSCVIDGETIIVGCPDDDDSGSGSGSAHVYRHLVSQNPCPGDLDGDRDTDQSDLGLLLSAYGSDDGGDLDGDGDTDQADLGILLGDYGCGT